MQEYNVDLEVFFLHSEKRLNISNDFLMNPIELLRCSLLRNWQTWNVRVKGLFPSQSLNFATTKAARSRKSCCFWKIQRSKTGWCNKWLAELRDNTVFCITVNQRTIVAASEIGRQLIRQKSHPSFRQFIRHSASSSQASQAFTNSR